MESYLDTRPLEARARAEKVCNGISDPARRVECIVGMLRIKRARIVAVNFFVCSRIAGEAASERTDIVDRGSEIPWGRHQRQCTNHVTVGDYEKTTDANGLCVPGVFVGDGEIRFQVLGQQALRFQLKSTTHRTACICCVRTLLWGRCDQRQLSIAPAGIEQAGIELQASVEEPVFSAQFIAPQGVRAVRPSLRYAARRGQGCV